MKRRLLAFALSFPITIMPFVANAADVVPYTAHAFAAAQKAGNPILVEITASWCPTCKAQKPILNKLGSPTRGLRILKFSTSTSIRKGRGALLQSHDAKHAHCFQGRCESARSVGDTNQDSIEALLERVI